MVMLHGRCRVDGSQGRANIDHKFIIEAPVIQVMANGRNVHSQTLQK